jgi:hypothetical protein
MMQIKFLRERPHVLITYIECFQDLFVRPSGMEMRENIGAQLRRESRTVWTFAKFYSSHALWVSWKSQHKQVKLSQYVSPICAD